MLAYTRANIVLNAIQIWVCITIFFFIPAIRKVPPCSFFSKHAIITGGLCFGICLICFVSCNSNLSYEHY